MWGLATGDAAAAGERRNIVSDPRGFQLAFLVRLGHIANISCVHVS